MALLVEAAGDSSYIRCYLEVGDMVSGSRYARGGHPLLGLTEVWKAKTWEFEK